MKMLNVVRSMTPVSDTKTDDPIFFGENIDVFSENELPQDFFLYVIKLGDKHCTRFGYGEAFKLDKGVLDGAPLEVISRVNAGTAKIVISWPLESFMDDSIFTEIHDYFNHHKIPLTSIIYLNCCPNGDELYRSFCDRNGIDSNRISKEYIPWYMYDRTNASEPYKVGNKSKMLFALNRRMHEHRCLMVTLMNKENLLDKFYMSFPSYHLGTNESFVEKTTGYLPLFSRYGLTEQDVKNVEPKLPMVLDIEDWDPYPLPITSDVLGKFYDDSLFSLVAETYFFSKVIHLTEKTFKPIINRHPFICFASPNTLKVIKSFGFKSFDTIIDESYDSIENHFERFDAIVKIIKDMATWSPEKIAKVSAEVEEIVNYNYDLMNTRGNVELNSFVEKYGVEKHV